MEELIGASDSFTSALRRYSKACRVAAEFFTSSHVVHNSCTLLKFITRELEAVAGHEIELRSTKCILAQTRNSARAISPINALPREILERIFDMVYRSARCSITTVHDINEDSGGHIRYPTRLVPDTLSHVCAHWRRVTLGAPRLWSHIDLVHGRGPSPLFGNLLCRGDTFAGRAIAQKFTIHLSLATQRHLGVGLCDMFDQIGQFYSTVGPRTKCFKLELWDDNSEFIELLERSLVHAVPGILEELALVDYTSKDGGFILAADREGYRDNSVTTRFQLLIPEHFLREILRSITVLHLINLFFPWTSSAYSGLNDLRLIATRKVRRVMAISLYSLRTILQSCPGLQIFHFDLPIDINAAISPLSITLTELQELNIRGMSLTQYEILLTMIKPGSKPLAFSLPVPPNDSGAPRSAFPLPVLEFFQRSNVTRLHLFSEGSEYYLSGLLAGLPVSSAGLRTLGLNAFHLAEGLVDREHPNINQTWPVKIDTFLMELSPYCHINTLRELARVCPIRVFATGNSMINSDTDDNKVTDLELAKIFPVVKNFYTQSPTDEWNNLGFLDW